MPDGVGLDTITGFVGAEYAAVPEPRSGVSRIHFVSCPSHAVSGAALYATDGGADGIRVYDIAGSLLARFRPRLQRLPVTDEMREAYEERVPALRSIA